MESSSCQLKLSDFDYEFPLELVAQQPVSNRDESRLLVYPANGKIEHRVFRDLPSVLPSGTLVLLNDTSVLQSRLHGFLRTGARIEIFLLEPTGPQSWRAMAKPLKKLREGTEVLFGGSRHGEVSAIVRKIEVAPDGEVPSIQVEFKAPGNITGFDFFQWLDETGETPLPPYIHRENKVRRNAEDRSRYETVFARVKGSVAAPTAGLHFTPSLIAALQKAGCDTATITLHVGGGTFLPVRQEDISGHQIHRESYMVPAATMSKILEAKREGRPICCVGTTSFRAIESFWLESVKNNQPVMEMAGEWRETALFIRPETSADRYKPHVAEFLITNFHQPKSTLLMLVSALVGFDETRRIYRDAIAERYRLFSYGDSSLLNINGDFPSS